MRNRQHPPTLPYNKSKLKERHSFILYLIPFFVFLFCNSLGLYAQQASKNEANDVLTAIESSQRYIDKLSINDLRVLPVGMQKTIGNIKVIIAVYDITYHSEYASMSVYAKMLIPQGDGTELFFGMEDVKLSYDGGIIGDAKLKLLGDITIPFDSNTKLVLKGSFQPKTEIKEDLTYAVLTCDGISEIGVSGEVQFATSFITKVNNETATNEAVIGAFKTVITDWNDLLVNINLPSFAIVGLDDYIFSCNNVVLDFSDTRNAQGMVFPETYKELYLPTGNETLWRGVYATAISMKLPEQFTRSDKPKERISIDAQHLIFDHNGVSGLFATNYAILPYDKGTASGWNFSVERFRLGMLANRVSEASFGGAIGIPLGEKCKLEYNATIDASNKYHLVVNPANELSFDVFKAKATIEKNSYVSLSLDNKKFKPQAVLHGKMGIQLRDDKSGSETAQFTGIKFQGLKLQTESPYFTIDEFGYEGKSVLANLPLSISNIGLKATDNQAILSFNFGIKLAEVVQANSSLSIVAERTGETNKQTWKYKELTVQDIVVSANIAEVMQLNGRLQLLRNDPIYGNAVGGSLLFALSEGLHGLSIEASAMFGKKDFSYWYVDAKAAFATGIPAGGVTLYGFSGGASYAMSKLPGSTNLQKTTCKYEPSSSMGLGLKAGVLFGIPTKQTLNCEASFEILFNEHGGLNFIGFYGQATMMGNVPSTGSLDKVSQVQTTLLQKEKAYADKYGIDALLKLKESNPSKVANEFTTLPSPIEGIMARVSIEYGFTRHTLDAKFDTYVNVAGGVIKGGLSGYKAGEGVLHISPTKWYVYVGRPDRPISLSIGIGGIRANSQSYFMLGDVIPPMPPPPKKVVELLKIPTTNLASNRNGASLATGKGIAFGSNFGFDTGDLKCLLFYARLDTQIGADVMLTHNNSIKCKGRQGIRGVNGWYGSGQAYTYLYGVFGVEARVFGKSYRLPIVSGSSAVLLQAQLPNPIWLKGDVALQYNVLRGLVRGRGNFELEFGEQCK